MPGVPGLSFAGGRRSHADVAAQEPCLELLDGRFVERLRAGPEQLRSQPRRAAVQARLEFAEEPGALLFVRSGGHVVGISTTDVLLVCLTW
jgi:hypothetical protein